MEENIREKARKVLGVPDEADMVMIRKAYRELVKKYHPDRNPDKKYSTEKFKLIAEAYEVLSGEKNYGRYSILKNNTDIADEPSSNEQTYWDWWMERFKDLF